jgi:hypothetical protein
MDIKDFRESKYFTFEGACPLWDTSRASIYVDLPGTEKSAEYLGSFIDDINVRLEWLDSHRRVIEDALIEDGMVSLAEDWVQSLPKEDGEDFYVVEDGQKVCLPITADDFRKSLRLVEAAVCFSGGKALASLELYIVCSPDYFAGHCIIATVSSRNKVECKSLAG